MNQCINNEHTVVVLWDTCWYGKHESAEFAFMIVKL